MIEERTTRRKRPMAMCREMMSAMMASADAEDGCPMATMFKGMMEKARFALWLALPGIALIIGGVAMLIEPRVLVWLMAATSILLGVVVLVVAGVIRRLGVRRRSG